MRKNSDIDECESKYDLVITSCVALRFILGALIIAFGMDYLKDGKFFSDSLIIHSIYMALTGPKGALSIVPFDSFNNTARVYRLIFFNQDMSFELIVVLSGLLYCLLFIFLIKSIKVRYNKNIFIVFLVFFIFDMIFLFQPSKDFISLFINILVLKLIISDIRGKNILIALILCFYAVFFREYYFIILSLFFLIKISSELNLKARVTLISLYILAFILVFYFTNYFDEIIMIRHTSAEVLGGYTNTLITDIFPSAPGEKNFIKYAANYIVTALRLIFPVEVLWKSPSRGVLFVPIQFIADFIVFKYAHVAARFAKIKNIFIYIISFFLTSVLFEPDFGSVFRHNMNIMPFILYLSFSVSYKNYNMQISGGQDYENTDADTCF